MRVLVTGASGFIGRATVQAALAGGHDVRALVRSGAAPAAPADVVRVVDLPSAADWRPVLAGVDVVVHLAGRAHVMRERAQDPLAAYRSVNVEGTRRLAEAAVEAGVGRLVFVSTVKVHGESTPNGPLTPDSPIVPADPYGRSKAEAEAVLRRIEAASGLDVVVVRPPLVYGAGVGANFLNLMRLVSHGLPLPLGRVENRRTLVYVENLADLLLRAAVHPLGPERTFLAADGPPVSTPELVRRLAAALGRPARLLPVPPAALRLAGTVTGRSAAVHRLLGSLEVDASGTERALGWRPPVPGEEGLRRTAAWFTAARTAP